MENKVDVVIGGEIITLKSGEQADYLQRIARYTDKKIEEIKSKSVTAAIDDHVRSLLIALNIADDYHKTLDKFQKLDAAYKEITTERDKLKEDLDKAQKELEEFVKSFDAKNAPEAENILTLAPPAPPQKQPLRKAR
ncbi:MAG: cell division protein ZapA [Defluviitaleaceae bacterium]|nr:cell division protein ZapA [Defluviitaleaceae bacterium]